ncbi:MAG: PQQ-binding-like beta-propeller repeat protein [Gemmatimonadaceae bacterium]
MLWIASAAAACGVTFHDVPRRGTNEVHQFLYVSSRAPFTHERVDSAPVLLWSAESGRGAVGAVALGEVVVAVATTDRWVHAFSTRTGRLYWRYRGEEAFSVGPVMGGGRIFVASDGVGGGKHEGQLTAIDMFTGRRIWRAAVGEVLAPLTLARGLVYGASRSGAVFAHEAASGERRWISYGAPTRSGPLLHDSLVIIATDADSLVVLNAATGTSIVRAAIPATSLAPLALVNDSTVALTSPAGRLLAIAIPSGAVRWNMDIGAPAYGAPVAIADTVFALTNDCVLWTVPVASPANADTATIGCRTVATPAITERGVVVATIGGELVYFDRGSRRRIWSRRVARGRGEGARAELRQTPMILNGQIVVAPLFGDVVSFR